MPRHRKMIRQAKFLDIPAIMQINKSNLPENYPAEFWIEIIQHHQSAVLTIDGTIQGYILVRVDGLIVSFAVNAEFRCQGWGKKLLDYAMKPNKAYWLQVRDSNERAIKLYENNGFKIKGDKVMNYYGPNQHAYVMTKGW